MGLADDSADTARQWEAMGGTPETRETFSTRAEWEARLDEIEATIAERYQRIRDLNAEISHLNRLCGAICRRGYGR